LVKDRLQTMGNAGDLPIYAKGQVIEKPFQEKGFALKEEKEGFSPKKRINGRQISSMFLRERI